MLNPVVQAVETVRTMISQGVDVNARDPETGMTPLHMAVQRENREVVRLLLNAKANQNLRDYKAQTAFQLAIDNCDPVIVKLFIDSGADVHTKNPLLGKTVLHAAAAKCDLDMMEYLLSRGADVNVRDYLDRTPLHDACLLSFSEVRCRKFFKFLLMNKANVHAVDSYNRTPLMHMLSKIAGSNAKKNVSHVRFLLPYFNVNTVDEQRRNILNFPWNTDMTKVIVEHLAKLKALGLPVRWDILKLIDEKSNFRSYFKTCTDELSDAKNTKFPNSKVSFFNVLVDSKKSLKNYAGNRDMIRDFKNSNCLRRFPVYGASMQKNIDKAMKTRELFNEACILLSDDCPVFSPNYLVVRDVLDCFGKKDLIKFCVKK